MTPANQLLVTDSQSNIESDQFSAPDLSNCSNFSTFSDIDSFFGPELSFGDLGPEECLPEECLQAWSSVFDSDDAVSITAPGSTPAKPLDISALANLENHANGDIESSIPTVQSLEVYSHNKLCCPLILILRQEWIFSLQKKLKGYFFPANQELAEERMDEISSDLGRIEKAGTLSPSVIRNTKIRRLFRTIMTLEMIPRDNELQIQINERVNCLLASWGEPAIVSNIQAQSKFTTQGTIIDLTGADSDHEYIIRPGTSKSMLLSSSSIGECLFISNIG
jgi:hypothetical protein